MLARLGLVAGLALAASQESAGPSAEPLVAPAQRQRLRALASELARTGELELVERMRDVLVGLGDAPESLARPMRDWERVALGAKPGRTARAALADKLGRELEELAELLAAEVEPRRSELARWILVLDSEQPEANAALGRARAPDGTWHSPEELAWDHGAREGARRLRSAAALDFDFERGASDNPALASLCGGGQRVAAAGIELHGALAPEPLERILRQALRAAALSRAVLGLPPLERHGPRRFVLLDGQDRTEPALAEALANGGLDEEEARAVRTLDLQSFFDRRGWETFRYVPEANVSAVILWRLLGQWVADDVQPCLRVGHLNWLCLSVLGAPLPLAVWLEEEGAGAPGAQRSSAGSAPLAGPRVLWRSARQSLWGCRAWMRQEARAGRDPPWARAMLDQDGKIRDAALLKTTLVCEMLQQEGRLGALMEATRGRSERVEAIAAALGEPLPELEARWRRWLDPARPGGLRQALARAPAPSGAGPFDAALLALNQARADALKGQEPEIRLVQLDPDLSRAAELHARYLTLNPEQKTRWPGVHAESADAPGFSPEGALAGARAVIGFDRDPERAVRGWLGTFYHRLPLLNPGLFGVGFGQSEEVVVLDASSLVLQPWREHVVVWPLADAVDVPTRFVPELPNPVPGADMAGLGYPLSVQLFFPVPTERVALTLELFRGAPEDGAAVECHVLSPDRPLQPALAPENAWGLVPKAPLARRTRYTARATWGERVRTWSFTTGE